MSGCRSAQPLHKPCGDAVVQTSGTAAWREELRHSHRPVGRWLHHGGNVDTQSHHARHHRAESANSHSAALWLHHSGGQPLRVKPHDTLHLFFFFEEKGGPKLDQTEVLPLTSLTMPYCLARLTHGFANTWDFAPCSK